MRKLAALAGGIALLAGFALATDAAAAERVRTRPVGENPLLNDARQPTSLQSGNLFIAMLPLKDDGNNVSRIVADREAVAEQRNIVAQARLLSGDLNEGLAQVDRLAQRLAVRQPRNIHIRMLRSGEQPGQDQIGVSPQQRDVAASQE